MEWEQQSLVDNPTYMRGIHAVAKACGLTHADVSAAAKALGYPSTRDVMMCDYKHLVTIIEGFIADEKYNKLKRMREAKRNAEMQIDDGVEWPIEHVILYKALCDAIDNYEKDMFSMK